MLAKKFTGHGDTRFMKLNYLTLTEISTFDSVRRVTKTYTKIVIPRLCVNQRFYIKNSDVLLINRLLDIFPAIFGRNHPNWWCGWQILG